MTETYRYQTANQFGGGGLSIAGPSSKRSDNLHHVLMHFLNTRIRIDDMNE